MMSVGLVGHGNFIIEPNQPKETELTRLRNCLGRTVATTIQNIAKTTAEALRTYEMDKTQLDKAVWYPTPYAKACIQLNQIARLEFLQKKGGFSHGYLSTKHFDYLLNNNEQRIPWAWRLKDNVCPSEAILKASSGISIVDCGAVCTMAQYIALLEVLGKEKFDRLFSAAYGQPLVIEYADHPLQPMSYFLSFTAAVDLPDKGSEGNREVKQGQIVGFNNHPNYPNKHRFGMAKNYNAACLDETPGQQTFVAHGLPDQGISEKQMKEFLADRYNQDSSAQAYLRFPTEQQPLCQEIMATDKGQLSCQEKINSKDVPGLDCCSFQDFNVGLVFDLIELPVEEVNIEWVRQHPEAKSSINMIETNRKIKQVCLIS